MYKLSHIAIPNSIVVFFEAIMNSYAQIFFASHKPFAVIILLVTFIDFYAGLTGMLAVITTTAGAYLLNLDKANIIKGLYGFNGLLVGLGLGIYYQLSWHLVFIVILSAVFTLFISVTLQGVLGKYNLPYLSLPFLAGMWIFTLATRHFEALGISERGIYTMNELYVIGGQSLVNIYEFFNHAAIPGVLKCYFISLSAILFQYNILAGILIATGLLFFSRIAFSLSIIGFSIAYVFYQGINANITLIDYRYIGFNYILTSIAIGGFFIIPSVRSYLSVGILVPLVAILSISLANILLHFNLALYSLPFNVIVILFLYVLKFRMQYSEKLSEVYYQYNSPEKNLYTFVNNINRFRHLEYIPIHLPFMGKWTISQGHDGEHTHKNEWRYAWDFIINDEHGKQFKNEGLTVGDYYCYGKPVIAPADGTIEDVIDNIEDNEIGYVDLKHNWGNTIIIKHEDDAYSKLSHLKKGSIIIKKGEKVFEGQPLAKCGNSGRSPYPHLHFQVQKSEKQGAETKFNPISSYTVHKDNYTSLHSFCIPSKDDTVSNIESNKIISETFHFYQGQELCFYVTNQNKIEEVKWIVKISSYNETYFECTNSRSKAYFYTKGDIFYFTHFEGRKSSFLYHFYLSCYKIHLSFYKGYELKDSIPLNQTFPKKILWPHDFISPFTQFLKSDYSLTYEYIDSLINPQLIKLKSSIRNSYFNKTISNNNYEIELDSEGIKRIAFTGKKGFVLKRKQSEG